MIRKALVAVLFLSSAACAAAEELPVIFNGKDLKGWKVPDDNIWWRVEEGVLQVRSGPKQQGQTLWTAQEFKNFVMEFDFRFGEGTVDTGVFVRSEREQIQIGISGSLKRDMTGSPYIAGKGYPVEAEGVKKLLKLTDWNTIKVQAIGGEYK